MTDQAVDFSELLECLANRLPAFREALLEQFRADLERVELAAGEVLLRKGEKAHSLYVVVSGMLRATTVLEDGRELTLSEFGCGDMAGEMAMLAGGGAYSASVSVAADAVLVRVPREALEKISKSAPQAIRDMASGIRRRLARDQLAVGLPKLFGPLDETMLRFVEARVEWVRLHAGKTLFAAGDKGEELYFVLGGRLRAVAGDGRVLSEMTRGESIGEIALLTGEARTATVVAIRDSDLVRISRQAFDEIVAKYPRVMQTIARIVVQRLRAKEGPGVAATTGKCIAVLAAGSGNAARAFTERLVIALGRVGPTLQLSASRLDTLLNRPGIAAADEDDAAGIRLTAWLDEQESHHQFLIYETDATPSLWTQRCLRQADEILLVAEAGSGVALNAVEKTLLGTSDAISRARQNLVLLHADGRRLPSGTSLWFANRNVQRNFHIRLDREDDFGRVARCLGDVAVGLVLGGGGARGLAHIGVVRALREAGVPIDMIGGTSMGAVMASLVAMDQDWEQMLETNREAWLHSKPHKEYSLPFISLIRSRRLDTMAKKIWGEFEIEDLWLNFFCISCNLSTAATMIHERGALWKAIRASASLPGVFVPVLSDGHILVDGGLVNNLPGDVMRERACRTLIVVDVGSEHEFIFKLPEFPSPWQFLRSRILPFAARIEVPHIVDVLIRTTDVSSSQKTRDVKRNADVCLRPPIDAYGVLQFEALDELADVGYRYAKAKLEELRGDQSLAGLFPVN
ncbi:MAG TPA: cyclic nucleotide-binding and patatin-like phospholipase domain-containing protein [Burkholderiales bacterium]|nr:cyclic nucleotide-binding and patatin-like phospholipase domain-containing protein [Burkholderiales bacterium]